MRGIPPMTMERSGFSLPELLVVLVVVGLLAGIFAPRIDVAKFRQDTAVLEVSTALNVAQQKAVLRGHSIEVGFDTARSRLVIHTDADNDRTVGPGEDVRVVELGDGVAFGLGAAKPLAKPLKGVTSTSPSRPPGSQACASPETAEPVRKAPSISRPCAQRSPDRSPRIPAR